MSAEVEVSKDEVPKEQQQKSLKQKINDHWQLGLKLLELLVCATCMALIYDPAQGTRLGKSHLEVIGIMYTTFSSYIIINLMFFVSRILKDKISYRTNIIFSALGCLMFILTGAMLLKAKADLQHRHFFHPHTNHLVMLLTTVFFTFLNAVIYATDSFLHLKFKKDL